VVLAAKGKTLGTFAVRAVRPGGKAVLLSLAGVDDRDAADALRGATVSVARGDLPPLENGEYYLCDLIGASVVSPDGIVGSVVEVRVHPTVDTLVVRTPEGDLLEQPIAEPWIAAVRMPEKRVELTGKGGLVSP
jgi:16S rRNA processing protein RimM